MQSVRDYIAAGVSTRDIPGRPRALRDAESERRLLAVAETPSRRSTVHWFVCNSADDLQSVRYRDRLLRPPPIIIIIISVLIQRFNATLLHDSFAAQNRSDD